MSSRVIAAPTVGGVASKHRPARSTTAGAARRVVDVASVVVVTSAVPLAEVESSPPLHARPANDDSTTTDAASPRFMRSVVRGQQPGEVLEEDEQHDEEHREPDRVRG